jgi:hypothetical protein
MAFHIIMRGEDVGLLLCDQLANWKRKILVESIGVGFLGLIFTLFRRLEKSVVTASEFGFQVSPDTMQGASGGAGFLDVVYAVLMENLFEIAAEAGTLERFGEEVSLQRVVLQVLADICEAFLAIEEGTDERIKGELHFVLLACICWHERPQSSLNFDGAVGAGSVGCARFSSADGKQEKSRKPYAPANRF